MLPTIYPDCDFDGFDSRFDFRFLMMHSFLILNQPVLASALRAERA